MYNNDIWQHQQTWMPDSSNILNWDNEKQCLDEDEPIMKLTRLQEIQEERRRRSYNKQLKRRK